MGELTDMPGATGRFPSEKIRPDDMGELAVAVGIANNRIILDFGKRPVQWIGMEAEQAEAFGGLLLEYAKKLRGLA